MGEHMNGQQHTAAHGKSGRRVVVLHLSVALIEQAILRPAVVHEHIRTLDLPDDCTVIAVEQNAQDRHNGVVRLYLETATDQWREVHVGELVPQVTATIHELRPDHESYQAARAQLLEAMQRQAAPEPA